jgi:hypothetical protein
VRGSGGERRAAEGQLEDNSRLYDHWLSVRAGPYSEASGLMDEGLSSRVMTGELKGRGCDIGREGERGVWVRG